MFAGYGDTVWPRSGVPVPTVRFLIGVDPGRDLAEQARDADTRLRAGLTAWAAPHHAVIATVGDEPPDHGRRLDRTPRVAVLTAAITGRDQPAPERTGSLMAARRPSADTYRVTAGDTLWAIARRTLGDARRWRDIFDLNEGRRQPGGRQLTDPRLILPGWRLRLPPTDKQAGPTTVPRPGRAGVNPSAPPPATRRPTPPTATPSAAPTLPPPPGAAARPARNGGSAWPLVDVALGATALGVGVGWVAGRRQRRPGTTASAAAWPAASTAAGPDPQTGTVGTVDHPPPDPATSPPLSVLRSPHDIAARALPAGRSPSPLADDAVRPRASGPHQPIHPPHATDTAIGTVVRWPNDWNPIGTGLIGPGAPAAARTILVNTLTTDPPPGTSRTGTVIATAAAMTLLLPDQPVPADTIPRLTIAGDLTQALNRLDQEILTRSRTTDDTDVTTPDSDSHDDQGSGSWPPLLLIAEPPPPADRIRLAAILLQGATLGIDAVILGPWPTGNTITVDHNGHPTSSDQSGSRRRTPRPDRHRPRNSTNHPAITGIRPASRARRPGTSRRPRYAFYSRTERPTIVCSLRRRWRRQRTTIHDTDRPIQRHGRPTLTRATARPAANWVRAYPVSPIASGSTYRSSAPHPTSPTRRRTPRHRRGGHRPGNCSPTSSATPAASPNTSCSKTSSATYPAAKSAPASTPTSTTCTNNSAPSADPAPTSPTPPTATS